MATIGENLKYFREKQGMTQTKLADVSGVPQTTISTIEHGATPNVRITNKLAIALSISIVQLLNEKEVAK